MNRQHGKRLKLAFCLALPALVSASGCGERDEQPAEARSGPVPAAADKGAGPGDRGREREKQLERMEAEIGSAIGSGAFAKAGQRLPEALRLAGEGGRDFEPYKARLLYAYGELMQETGNDAEARRHYADAMALFQYRGDAEGQFRTSLAIGRLEVRLGDTAAAARRYDAAEALLPGVKDRRLPALYRLARGQLASRQVKHDLALQHFQEALRVFETVDDRQSVAETLLLIAAEEDALAASGACRRSLERASGIFRERKDIDGEARALHRLALLAAREKNFKGARRLLLSVQELYGRLDRKSAQAAVTREINALPE